MASTINYIFNRKILNPAVKSFDFARVANLPEKKNTLLAWKNTIELQALEKVSEISIQGKFLTDIFSIVLGYKEITDNPNEWNLTHEQKTVQDATRADGALGFFNSKLKDIRIVIELKSPGIDLDAKQIRASGKVTPVEQAFSYVPKSGKKCNWVIVSNYIELRLYNAKSSIEYENFKISKLTDDIEFQRFYYLLCRENLILKNSDSIIDSLYKRNEEAGENISKKFYLEYKQTRVYLFRHIKKNNSSKNDILILEKVQKLLDRFIFVCFCEDTGLLPERILRKRIKHAKESLSFTENKIWAELKGLFRAIDKGAPPHDINAFNGGLFTEDPDIDSLVITDEVFDELALITNYDFNSDLNVNILGHIFEQSITDLEELKAGIKGEEIGKQRGKRKKEGIYYTPEYITKYIVEQSVGGWLDDRKKELGIDKLPELTEKDFKSIKFTKAGITYNKKVEQHIGFWEAYKDELANIKVLDPACGSGAFLNQTFDFLYREGRKLNEILAKLRIGYTTIFDLDKHILSNNLFGIDLNEESVEITKLSLWLKTANRHSALTTLDNNIKCGNSLINDPSVAGNRAFKWEKEFAEIMENGGFDVVIGNPPYGDFFDKNTKNFLRQAFIETFSGTFDIYIMFFQLAISLIRDNGKLGFITPHTFLDYPQFTALRSYILKTVNIEDLIRIPNVFDDPIVDNVISIFNKKDYKLTSYKSTFYRHKVNNFNNINILEFNYNNLSSLQFCISSLEQIDINKIYSNSHPLKYYVTICQGITTGGNDIFLMDQDAIKAKKIEDLFVKPALLGADIDRYLP